MIKPYHVDNLGVSSGYDCLVGPAGFECCVPQPDSINGPEYGIWSRNLAPVVDRLNAYETEVARLRAELTDLQGRLLNPIRSSATNVRVDIDASSPVSGPL